jgi:hypothetical protein
LAGREKSDDKKSREVYPHSDMKAKRPAAAMRNAPGWVGAGGGLSIEEERL